MITNIDIDETVVAEAMRLSGARTKREVVDRALREMVARASRPSVRELFGIGGVDPEYDPKAPWARGAEVGQHRVEQGRATYRVASKPANKLEPKKSAEPGKPAKSVRARKT
jgi:Arc/MetJ family transcription regulator